MSIGKINCDHILSAQGRSQTPEAQEYRELRKALIARPLSTAELARVGSIGYFLIVPFGEPYNAAEKQREFAAMLSIQHSLQLAASRVGEPK